MTKPLITVCGAPGTGKSTEVLKAFQNSLAILSSPNNSHYFRKLLGSKLKDTHYKPPKKIKLIDTHAVGTTSESYSWLKPGDAKSTFDERGSMLPVSQLHQLEATITAVVSKSLSAVMAGELPPYDNVILDEWGEFMERVFAEIVPTCIANTGKIDTRAAYGVMNEWVGKMFNWLKQLTSCGVGVAVVMHDREPDGDKKGGPKAPSSTIATRICAMSDGVIQRYMKDAEVGPDGKRGSPQYLWSASAGEQWHRKLRGLEPEEAETIATMDLLDIIELAGFEMM